MPNNHQIDDALLDRLSTLAKLELPADRRLLLRQQLERLVAAFANLEDADIDDGAESSRPGIGPEQSRGLRTDVAEAPPSREDVLQNAPQRTADSFVVPRVMEG